MTDGKYAAYSPHELISSTLVELSGALANEYEQPTLTWLSYSVLNEHRSNILLTIHQKTSFASGSSRLFFFLEMDLSKTTKYRRHVNRAVV